MLVFYCLDKEIKTAFGQSSVWAGNQNLLIHAFRVTKPEQETHLHSNNNSPSHGVEGFQSAFVHLIVLSNKQYSYTGMPSFYF